MSSASKESSWLALRDVVGVVMSALAPMTTQSTQNPSREKRRKE